MSVITLQIKKTVGLIHQPNTSIIQHVLKEYKIRKEFIQKENNIPVIMARYTGVLVHSEAAVPDNVRTSPNRRHAQRMSSNNSLVCHNFILGPLM